MSSPTVIGGVVAKFPTVKITPAARLFFGQIPLRDGVANPIGMPWVVLLDNGTTPEFDTQYNPVEVTRFVFRIYAQSGADEQSIASGIRYGGGGIADRLGYDFGSLDLTGLRLMQMVREFEQSFQEEKRGDGGLPVFRWEMHYSATAQRTA